MPARHPLKDLPLDHFVAAGHGASLKRPLSPSTLLSPSKRRILTAEGLYSPEKKRKQITPSRQLFTDRILPPQFTPKNHDFAHGSHPVPRPSAERRPLDASSLPGTPVARIGSAHKLAPSPEITSNNLSHDSAADTHSATHGSPSMLIPREMPTFSDRQTVHWPGFDVYADTHISIPTSTSSSVQPSIRMETLDLEEIKENSRPKRITEKRSTLDVATITKASMAAHMDNIFHKPNDISIMSMLLSSPNYHMTPEEKELKRKRMKFIMVRETDDDGNEEEDVEQQL